MKARAATCLGVLTAVAGCRVSLPAASPPRPAPPSVVVERELIGRSVEGRSIEDILIRLQPE